MIYIILPAYNEGDGVSRQITSIESYMEQLKFPYEIIVVDDGSRDHTVSEVERCRKSQDNIHLIRHERNFGPGMAFKSGYDYVHSKVKDRDVVITMDCDNTRSIKTLGLMIHKVQEGYEVILGSIFTTGGMFIGVPFPRKLMTYAANFMYRVCFPIKGIRNYTGFYRAVRGSALKQAYDHYGYHFVTLKGFGCMAEILIKFRKLQMFIAEVPMIIRYDLKTSPSKLKIFETVREHVNTMLGHSLKQQSDERE